MKKLINFVMFALTVGVILVMISIGLQLAEKVIRDNPPSGTLTVNSLDNPQVVLTQGQKLSVNADGLLVRLKDTPEAKPLFVSGETWTYVPARPVQIYFLSRFEAGKTAMYIRRVESITLTYNSEGRKVLTVVSKNDAGKSWAIAYDVDKENIEAEWADAPLHDLP